MKKKVKIQKKKAPIGGQTEEEKEKIKKKEEAIRPLEDQWKRENYSY